MTFDHSDQAHEKAHILYEGKRVPHHSCGICIAATFDLPTRPFQSLRKGGVTALVAGKKRVDFAQALDELRSRFGVRVVRVDSGGALNGVLLRAGLVDELHLLVHPVLAGQAGRTTFFSDPGASPGSHLGAEGRIPLRLLETKPLEQGLLLLSYALPRSPAKAGDVRFA